MKPKLIESPERLLKLWREYVQWCAENPYTKNDFRGSDAIEVELKQERPPIIEGFEGWLSKQDIIRDLKDYLANTDGAYDDFKEVVKQIRSESRGILTQGALSNVWNANLAGRYLGIANVTEQKITHELDTSSLQDKLTEGEILLYRELIKKTCNAPAKAIDRR